MSTERGRPTGPGGACDAQPTLLWAWPSVATPTEEWAWLWVTCYTHSAVGVARLSQGRVGVAVGHMLHKTHSVVGVATLNHAHNRVGVGHMLYGATPSLLGPWLH